MQVVNLTEYRKARNYEDVQSEIERRAEIRRRRHAMMLACEWKIQDLDDDLPPGVNTELLFVREDELIDPKFDPVFKDKNGDEMFEMRMAEAYETAKDQIEMIQRVNEETIREMRLN